MDPDVSAEVATPSAGGFGGWLSSLFQGGNTPDSAAPPVNGSSGGASFMGAMPGIAQAGQAIQKAMGQQQQGNQPAASIIPPRPTPNPYATALASVMAGLNAKNRIGAQNQGNGTQANPTGGTQ